ncbi:MAG: hypothetical protein QXI19_00045 [Candidatus Caldarchaeum sp.]
MLKVVKTCVYVWSAVDVGSEEPLALEASYGRCCLDKPKAVVDKGPRCP